MKTIDNIPITCDLNDLKCLIIADLSTVFSLHTLLVVISLANCSANSLMIAVNVWWWLELKINFDQASNFNTLKSYFIYGLNPLYCLKDPLIAGQHKGLPWGFTYFLSLNKGIYLSILTIKKLITSISQFACLLQRDQK